MRILMVGDVVGRAGRRAFARYTRELRASRGIDLVIVNGENASHGKGLTAKAARELQESGADIITGGNHTWQYRDLRDIMDEPYILRPGNYPAGAPGHGWCVYQWRGADVLVINLQGRAFMQNIDCPFTLAERIIEEQRADVVCVDFHAEATSEKQALGWLLDGRATAVVGTHTHVQTADARILPQGTGYMTDLGMCGPWQSVIGTQVQGVLRRTMSGLPERFEVADGPCEYCGAILDIGSDNRLRSMEAVRIVEP